LAEAAYELEAFQPNLTRAEADLRIAMLTAKLKLLDEPPHTCSFASQLRLSVKEVKVRLRSATALAATILPAEAPVARYRLKRLIG